MSTPILSLPPELLLSILSHLPLPDLTQLPSTCVTFKSLFQTNESTIFRSAALLHGYTDPSHHDAAVSDLESPLGKRVMQPEITSWFSFCKRCYLLNKAWSGKAPSSQTEYPATGTSVTRFKVDEKRGFIACTSSRGGLAVTDMEDRSRALWKISSIHVRMFAHVEYENGFLAFDRLGNIKEIWKHIPDCQPDDPQVIPRARPDAAQLTAETWPSEVDQTDRRGRFRPHCLLIPPSDFHGHLSAYHLVYPYLISSGLQRAFIWDVRTGQIVQDLNTFQSLNGAEGPVPMTSQVSYVEFSSGYAFIARTQGIQIFTRSDLKRGNGTLVTQIATNKMYYGRRYYSLVSPDSSSFLEIDLDRQAMESGMSMIPQTVHVEYKSPDDEKMQYLFDSPIAVHVSPDGKHLFVLLSKPHLIIIPYWENVLLSTDSIPCYDITANNGQVLLKKVLMYGNYGHTVRLGSISAFSRYLAVEPQQSTDGKVRVAVATTGGLFVLNITMPPSYESIPPEEGLDLQMDICLAGQQLLSRPDSKPLKDISCLQISPSGVWVNFPPEADNEIRPAEFPPLSSYYNSLDDVPSYQELIHSIQEYNIGLFQADLEGDDDDDMEDGHVPDNRTVWSINF